MPAAAGGYNNFGKRKKKDGYGRPWCDPEFRQRLQALRTDMVQRAANVLTASAMEAVKTLLSLQEGSVADHPGANGQAA
jgi:hypothetical protein